jgi:hypothetical protein
MGNNLPSPYYTTQSVPHGAYPYGASCMRTWCKFGGHELHVEPLSTALTPVGGLQMFTEERTALVFKEQE